MVLDPHSTRPLYEQLADLLRAAIRSNEPPPGGRLPTEEELASTHGVSRTTVRLALGRLKAEGLLESAPGRGTTVRQQPPMLLRSTERLVTRGSGSRGPAYLGYGPVAAAHIKPPVEQIQEVVTVPAPEQIAVRLNIDEGAEVWTRRRITTVDGDPVMTCDTYYPADLVADTSITRPEPLLGRDWSVLEGDLGKRVAYAIEDLQFRPATPEERERLRARQDAGIIHLLSTVYDTEGQPFKVTDFRLLADRHLLSYRIEATPSGQ